MSKSNREQKSAPLGASLIVLSSLFYASYGIWTTLMGDFFGGYTASALRSAIVVLILLIVAFFLKSFQPINLRHTWKYLVGMTISSAFVWGPLYYAILHAGIGVSLAINYAVLVIGLFFFGWLLANEHFTKDKAIATAVGFMGLWLVFSPSVAHAGWLPLTAAAVSALGAAFCMVCAKRISYNATQSTLAVWVTSVIANVPMALLVGEAMPAIGLHIQWVWLVVFSVASVIASWAYVGGLKLIDAGAAGIIGLLEIVFAVVFGVVFFDERPAGLVYLGIGVILIAASIPYVKDYNAQRGRMEQNT